MRSALELVYALTDRDVPTGQRRDLTRDFSIEFGWRPNDFIETHSALSTASLVVEHGLDNAAVLSFLPAERRLRDIRVARTAKHCRNCVQQPCGLACVD